MKLTFLNQSAPVITGIFSGSSPAGLIAEARNCEFEGATGIAISLHDLPPEYRTLQHLKSVIDAVRLPFMFIFYRDGKENLGDDARQEILLTAVDAGASIIDVMGDLYDPSPMELTRNPQAIDQQMRLIDKIHSKGAHALISSHIYSPRTCEQVLEHMLEIQSRGPDVVKIVTTVDTPEQLTEAIKTTMALKHELKVPFIHLCNGKYSRPHRFLGPALGTSILFAVSHYEPRYQMSQPTIRSMKAVLENLHWNINQVM